MKKPHLYYTIQVIIVMHILAGCGIQENEVIDINGMEITRGLINQLTSDAGRTYKLFIKHNWIQDPSQEFTGERVDTVRNGVVFQEIFEDKAFEMYNQYRYRLIDANKYIFLSNPKYTRSGNLAYDLVIVEANNQFQVLKIMNINGIVEGISHQKIFDRLASIHQSNPIEIYQIDEHNVNMKLKKRPDQKTLNSIAEICPKYEYFQYSLKLIWDK